MLLVSFWPGLIITINRQAERETRRECFSLLTPGWIHQTRQEPRCEFESAALELVPVELGSGPWIGPTLPRCIGGVAPFRPHLSLLLPLGGGNLGFGGGGFVVVLSLAWGGGGEC